MKLRCIELEQNGNHIYVGKVKMGDLVYKTKTDIWRHNNQEGYQREVTISRAKAYGRYIGKTRGIAPNTVLINIRDNSGIAFDGEYLNVPDTTALWIVDGQHRLKGLEDAIESGFVNIRDFEVPIIVTLFKEGYEEAKQFAIINRTQKGIKSDLAERFLQKAVRTEGKQSIYSQAEAGVITEILRGYDWKPKAIEITDWLNENAKSIWNNRIRLPNEPKVETTVSQKTFMDSLEPILKDTYFSLKNSETIEQVLNNYWSAIRETWPEPFTDPTSYVLLKLTGVMSMHKLFLSVVGYCTDREGKRDLTKEKLISVLKGFKKANIDSSFWTSNGNGGRYGTNKQGIRMLVEELEDLLRSTSGSDAKDLVL